MAIEHVQSVAGSTTATTSDAIVIPTVEPEDFLILACTNKGATAVPTVEDDDTGGNTWARLDGSATNGASVWFKRATADTSGKTITASGFTTACTVGLSVYRGVPGDTPENLSVQSLGSGVETVTGITPSQPDSLVCFFTMNRNVATSVGTPTAAVTGAMNERFDVVNSTVGQTCGIEHASDIVTGPTGDITWTQTNSGHITILFDMAGPEVSDTAAPAAGRGKGSKKRQRRRIMLPDGRILIPATDEDYRHAVEWIIALKPQQEPEILPPVPAMPASAPKPKTTKRLPRAAKSTPVETLPDEFYRALEINRQSVLYWQTIAKAWQDHQADEEAVELLLLS